MAAGEDGELVDHYSVLGLPSGEEGAKLTLEEIRKAFRTQSLSRHPDKRPGDPTATADFQRLRASYDAICDPSARRLLDARLRLRLRLRRSRKKNPTSTSTSTSTSSILEDMFPEVFEWWRAESAKSRAEYKKFRAEIRKSWAEREAWYTEKVFPLVSEETKASILKHVFRRRRPKKKGTR
uniref:J domain-containing protein n=1 Tax=Ananas comosus var. bracteatus TaxID=296719 RepID=A0A6V7PWW7_ANACO|nr:unnamed protein product [Ananas comosus var. bracteatus]